MLTPIHSPLAPPAIGPYSPAIRAGNLLFVSGQIALGPTGQEVLPDAVADQATQAMDNLTALLAAAGATWANVAKTTIYLLTMDDFAAVNNVYQARLQPPYPARETVAVAGLPRGAKVEISVIAHLSA